MWLLLPGMETPSPWAAENGIAEGMSATAFAPNQTATREQMVTFLARFAEFSGVDTTATGDLGDFTDASKVSAYAEDAMTWAVHTGIIHGMGNGQTGSQGHRHQGPICNYGSATV